MNSKVTKKPKTRKSRHGVHKAGSVRMHIYTNPFRKAVALLAANECDLSLTDVVWAGIEAVAKGRGILDGEGNVTQKFADQFAVVLELVKQTETKA